MKDAKYQLSSVVEFDDTCMKRQGCGRITEIRAKLNESSVTYYEYLVADWWVDETFITGIYGLTGKKSNSV